eukprot:3683170-Pyramimonas_sp.AAC.1
MVRTSWRPNMWSMHSNIIRTLNTSAVSFPDPPGRPLLGRLGRPPPRCNESRLSSRVAENVRGGRGHTEESPRFCQPEGLSRRDSSQYRV